MTEKNLLSRVKMCGDVYNEKSCSEQARTSGRLMGKWPRLGGDFKEDPQEGKEGMRYSRLGRTGGCRGAGPQAQ